MKFTVLDMQVLANTRGGQCLSKEYTNNYTKLTWQCKEGHQWDAVPASVKRGKWCPTCGGAQKGTLEEMQRIAEGKGGLCLSRKYTNNYSKLRWQCKEGHQWDAVPGSVTRGFWCPFCAGHHKGTIEEMQRIAEARAGKCLSREYTNKRSKLIWQCKEGHQWDATPGSVTRGCWCPSCARNRLKGTLEEMRKVAEGRGGKCLSMEYVNDQTRLNWQCRDGHRWKATPNNVKQGHWCPDCAAGRQIGTIKEMRRIAASRAGKCLSAEYVNGQTKLTWQCKEGHHWKALPRNIKQGHWCPRCARENR